MAYWAAFLPQRSLHLYLGFLGFEDHNGIVTNMHLASGRAPECLLVTLGLAHRTPSVNGH